MQSARREPETTQRQKEDCCCCRRPRLKGWITIKTLVPWAAKVITSFQKQCPQWNWPLWYVFSLFVTGHTQPDRVYSSFSFWWHLLAAASEGRTRIPTACSLIAHSLQENFSASSTLQRLSFNKTSCVCVCSHSTCSNFLSHLSKTKQIKYIFFPHLWIHSFSLCLLSPCRNLKFYIV